MNRYLRSISKMQWVWLALQDSRYKSKFWKHFHNIDKKGNLWWYYCVAKSIYNLCPLLSRCSFCKINDYLLDYLEAKNKHCEEECQYCLLKFSSNCTTQGRKLLHWLEGGCHE